MKLYILNMKTDIARKEFILDQLRILKIKNYEFVDAVNGKEHISDNNCDRDKFKSQYSRDILPGEWGCATSHLKVYDKIIESNEVSMIIEDDVIFDAEIINIIKSTKPIPFDFDVIFLNKHHASNIFPNYGGTNEYQEYENFRFERLHTDRIKIVLMPYWTTASYIITPTAAKKVKQINTPKIHRLADSWYDFGLEKMFKSDKEFFKQNQKTFTSTIR